MVWREGRRRGKSKWRGRECPGGKEVEGRGSRGRGKVEGGKGERKEEGGMESAHEVGGLNSGKDP